MSEMDTDLLEEAERYAAEIDQGEKFGSLLDAYYNGAMRTHRRAMDDAEQSSTDKPHYENPAPEDATDAVSRGEDNGRTRESPIYAYTEEFQRCGRTVVDPEPCTVDGRDMSFLINVLYELARGSPNEKAIRDGVAKMHNDICGLQAAVLLLNAAALSPSTVVPGERK